MKREMTGHPIDYDADGIPCEGWLARASAPRGAVVLIHQWAGVSDYEQRRAEMLAAEGYDAFALDLFGKGVRPTDTPARVAEIGRYYADRRLMRARAAAGLAAAAAQGLGRVVLVGYCFGGSVALEVARQQPAGVIGYASFHGGLEVPEGQDFRAAKAPVRIYHGGADQNPDMSAFARVITAMEEAATPYRATVYSGAPHAFTHFDTDRYRADADRESWADFLAFLGGCFA